MENRSHAFAAGLFTIVLGLAIVAALLWFRRDTTVRVPYDVVTTGAVTGLAVNAPVRLRGLPVGRVTSIGFEPGNAADIVIRIMVNQGVPITRATHAALGLQGVTGMAFIQLDDRGADRTPLVTSADHVAVIAMRPGLLERLQDRGEALLGQVEVLTSNLQRLTDAQARQQFLGTAASIQHAADGVDTLTRKAAPALAQLPRTMATLNRTLASANQLMATMNRPDGPLIGNLNKLGRTADHISLQVDDMSARVEYETLPRVEALSDDVRSATRSLARAADTFSDHPSSVLFGAPAAAPGPGEPGFEWGRAGASPAKP